MNVEPFQFRWFIISQQMNSKPLVSTEDTTSLNMIEMTLICVHYVSVERNTKKIRQAKSTWEKKPQKTKAELNDRHYK